MKSLVMKSEMCHHAGPSCKHNNNNNSATMLSQRSCVYVRHFFDIFQKCFVSVTNFCLSLTTNPFPHADKPSYRQSSIRPFIQTSVHVPIFKHRREINLYVASTMIGGAMHLCHIIAYCLLLYFMVMNFTVDF